MIKSVAVAYIVDRQSGGLQGAQKMMQKGFEK